jgi:hypothetical protein
MSMQRGGDDAFELEVDEEVASRRHAELTGVRVHAVTWGAVNAFLFMIWLVTGADFPWFLFPAGGWGIPLAIHAAIATQPIDRVRVRKEVERRHLELEAPEFYDDEDDDD